MQYQKKQLDHRLLFNKNILPLFDEERNSVGIVLQRSIELLHSPVVSEQVSVQRLDHLLLEVPLVQKETQSFRFHTHKFEGFFVVGIFQRFLGFTEVFDEVTDLVENVDFLQQQGLIGVSDYNEELLERGLFALQELFSIVFRLQFV